ncbi:cytochrome c3 family protein [Persephonella sp. IF05-L8]|uniref:cytochrome c3 family protein n=1 Tax=Persephonella sp. IF05-L8 TaxID=1158338 RepID=UPI0004973E4B
MKRLILAGIIASVGLLTASSMAVIDGSAHDLADPNNKIRAADPNDVNGEICVFCHTPHGSNTDFVGAPLWNKQITTTTTYQVYGGGQTTAGTTVGQPGDVSMACLSCHDGVNAINSIINMPGGGFTNPQLVAFTLDGGVSTIPTGTAATMPTDSRGYIGTDLRNDHPVGVVYTEGVASLRPTTEPLPWDSNKTIASLLRNNKVECVSCHDPHKGENDAFLRAPNTNSQLCTTCHAK